MQEAFEYRGYEIARSGANLIARSVDDDDLALVSKDLERLTAAIDELWDGLEAGETPAWFVGSTVDLDESQAEQPLAGPMAPQSRAFVQLNAGHLMAALSGLAVAVPLAIFMHVGLRAVEPEIVFTVAVCAVALIDMWPALLLACLSAVAFNYSVVPPVTTFTAPSEAEIVYFLINILVAVLIPALVKRLVEARRARVRIPNT